MRSAFAVFAGAALLTAAVVVAEIGGVGGSAASASVSPSSAGFLHGARPLAAPRPPVWAHGANRSGSLRRTSTASPSSDGNLLVTITCSRSKVDDTVPVYFTSNVSGNASYTYVWNFGDNVTSSLADPSHVYLAGTSGNQSIVLHVFGPNGSSGRASMALPVSWDVGIVGPAKPPTGGVGSPILLQTTISYGVPPFSYFWEFGDHNVSHSATPTHVYTRPGTYQAEEWVNDSAGGQSTFTEFVVVPYPNSTTSSPSTSNDFAYVLIAVGAVVVIGAVVLVSRSSKPPP